MEATRRGETPLDVLNRLDGTAPLSSSDAGLYAAEQLADQVAWNPERFDLDLIVGEVMDWSTPEGVGTPRDLLAWFKEADGILMSQATGMPACFGPNYRVGPGRYVSEQTWEAVLPTKSERCLYLILANEGTDEDILANTFDNMGSADWLVFESDLALNADPEAFFVPIGRDDFTQEELEELAASRPDLFSGAELTDLSKTGGHRGNDSLARQATEARGASDPCEDQGRKEGISRDGR